MLYAPHLVAADPSILSGLPLGTSPPSVINITLAFDRSLTAGGIGIGSNEVGTISDSNGPPVTFAMIISTSRFAAVCSTNSSRISPRRK